MDRYCCFIYSGSNTRCEQNADVEIFAQTGDFEDYTDSCFVHIGYMLGTITKAEWGTYNWQVNLIPEVSDETTSPQADSPGS